MLRIRKRNFTLPHIFTGVSVFLFGMMGSIGILHALNVPSDTVKPAETTDNRPAEKTQPSTDTQPVVTNDQTEEPLAPALSQQSPMLHSTPVARQSENQAASTPSNAPAGPTATPPPEQQPTNTTPVPTTDPAPVPTTDPAPVDPPPADQVPIIDN